VSDTTAILSDAQYNLDHHNLATASIGIAVSRGERLAYFLGQRYIEPLDSNITSVAATYQLTPKYTIGFRQSFDWSVNHNVTTDVTFLRHLDRAYLAVTLRYDEIGSQSGFMINFFPEGLGKAGAGTSALGQVFGN